MRVFATLTLLILFLFFPCSSDALTLAMPSWDFNIANLAKHTDLVVLGKVTGMRLIPQEYATSITLNVESVIKGDPATGDRLLRFRVSGHAGMKKYRGKRILWDVVGSLEFRLGERLLLFMKKYHGDYQVFLHRYGKRIITDNKVSIPYTYKTNQYSDYHNEMRERRVNRFVELPLDLVVKVTKASIKDYDAIMEIEADVATAVSLTEKGARPSLSVELLKRFEETADQILEKRAADDESSGTRQRETIEGKSLEPPITIESDNSVDIPDPNLRTAIERELGRISIAPITAADMESLTTLHASFAEISTLTGLEYAINLTHLYLANNRISDISAVSGLTNLATLYLNRNEISDVSPLSGLTNLTELEFQSNRISDVSALSKLTNLTTLYLNGNKISDISALAGLSNLTHLGLDFNRISDLSPLSGLINLIHLGLGSNRISDLSPLSGLTNLLLLGLGVNRISDLSPLSGLTNLIELDLDTNTISDISVLAGLTNLTTGLDLDANSISDLSPLARLTNLTRLELKTNSISNLAPLAGLTNLAFLWLDANTISDISVLAGLTNLTGLGLRDNNISDILPLVANTGLKRGDNVYVRDNPLSAKSINTHIPALQSRGVTVHFE